MMLLASAALGGLGGLFDGFGASSSNKRQAEAAAERRANLEGLIKQMEGLNTTVQSSDTTSSRINDLSRVMQAQGSAAGVAGSGMMQNNLSSVLGSLIMEDQGRKDAFAQQTNNQIGGVMSDASFGTPDPSQYNVFLDTLLGGLGGAATGAASGIGTYAANGINPFASQAAPAMQAGSDPFMDMLMRAMQGGQGNAMQIPKPMVSGGYTPQMNTFRPGSPY